MIDYLEQSKKIRDEMVVLKPKIAQKRYELEELERKYYELEGTMLTIRQKMESEGLEHGVLHDQLRSDFNIMRDGREHVVVDDNFAFPYYVSRAFIQCAKCGEFHVLVEFKIPRHVYYSSDGSLRPQDPYDIIALRGARANQDGFYECPACVDMSTDENASERPQEGFPSIFAPGDEKVADKKKKR